METALASAPQGTSCQQADCWPEHKGSKSPMWLGSITKTCQPAKYAVHCGGLRRL
jgi:hypothetical protein